MALSAREIYNTATILAKKLKIAVIYPDDPDRTILINHLKRMGFQVSVLWPIPSSFPQSTDLVFLSCQPDTKDSYGSWPNLGEIPMVAILTYESPVFLDYALSIGANAAITTPIRESGLLSVITFAINNSTRNSKMLEKIKRLENKIKFANQLAQAKTILINMHGFTESEAYEALRRQAMSKRISIEEISQSIIQASDVFSKIKLNKNN
jgi:AmiR/NasT family two-component response regulator